METAVASTGADAGTLPEARQRQRPRRRQQQQQSPAARSPPDTNPPAQSDSEDTSGWGGLFGGWGWGLDDAASSQRGDQPCRQGVHKAAAASAAATPPPPQRLARSPAVSAGDQQQQYAAAMAPLATPGGTTAVGEILHEVEGGLTEVAEELTHAVGGLLTSVNSACRRAAAVLLWDGSGGGGGGGGGGGSAAAMAYATPVSARGAAMGGVGSDVGARSARQQWKGTTDQADSKASCSAATVSPTKHRHQPRHYQHTQYPPHHHHHQQQQSLSSPAGSAATSAAATASAAGRPLPSPGQRAMAKEVLRLRTEVGRLQQDQARANAELRAARAAREELQARLDAAVAAAAAAAAVTQARQRVQEEAGEEEEEEEGQVESGEGAAGGVPVLEGQQVASMPQPPVWPLVFEDAAAFEAAVASQVQGLVAQKRALSEEVLALRRQNDALLALLRYSHAAAASASGSLLPPDDASCPIYFETPAASGTAAAAAGTAAAEGSGASGGCVAAEDVSACSGAGPCASSPAAVEAAGARSASAYSGVGQAGAAVESPQQGRRGRVRRQRHASAADGLSDCESECGSSGRPTALAGGACDEGVLEAPASDEPCGNEATNTPGSEEGEHTATAMDGRAAGSCSAESGCEAAAVSVADVGCGDRDEALGSPASNQEVADAMPSPGSGGRNSATPCASSGSRGSCPAAAGGCSSAVGADDATGAAPACGSPANEATSKGQSGSWGAWD